MHDPATSPISFRAGDEDTALVLPPGGSSCTCPLCHGLLPDRSPMCFNCDENARALDGLVQPVVAISLYAKPSALRDWLTFYKEADDAEADAAAREAIARILKRFFDENSQWVSRLGVDGAVIVPSTLRPPPHPLARLLREHAVLPAPIVHGLRRTTAPLGHNRPSRDAFAVPSSMDAKRVLLIDDVYTSGARAQSVAYALRSAGVEVAALCVIARRYNPDYSDQSRFVFEQQSARPFSWKLGDRGATRT